MPLHDHHHAGGDGHSHGNSLLLGIILHKIPVAVVLMALLLQSGLSKWRAVLWLLVFAAMMPLGTALSHFLGEHFIRDVAHYPALILGVVLGILLHISTTILFESNENHLFNRYKFGVIIFGILIAYLTQ